jgi:uncharacterized protein (TIGR02145 family)
MSKAIVNTFKKLDTDTSQNKQDQSSFYDAQNLRLISDEPLSNGALVNYKGTKAKIRIGNRNTNVVGYAEVGSELILLSTTDEDVYSPVIPESTKTIDSNDFGHLYNWYAINDSRNIAPVGWHVATESELINLINYLGGSTVSGVKLKDYGIDYWPTPNTGADNSIGFTAMASGYKSHNLPLNKFYSEYRLWTSTSSSSTNAKSMSIYSAYDYSEIKNTGKWYALSVRCVRDSGNLSNTAIDYDGNTYNSVDINGVRWLSSDLKATKYRNGDSISKDSTSGDTESYYDHGGASITVTIPASGGELISTANNYISSVVLSEDDTVEQLKLLYLCLDNGLGFRDKKYIETIGRYENEFSKKIYFAVEGQPIRVFNIYQSEDKVLPITTPVNTLDILPNSSVPLISYPDDFLISGGTLESGRIQYACRLFNKYGSETTFSTCSELISLTSSIANGTSEFKGSDIEVNSGKSVKINIDLQDDNFSNIRIYSIHYKTKDTPVISLVGETAINSQSFTFIDNGTILDTVTLEEFNIFGGKLVSAETLGTKNNILFAANTKELSENINLDCRAYRFKNVTRVNSSLNILDWSLTKIKLSSVQTITYTPLIKLTIPKTGTETGYYKMKSVEPGGNTFTIVNEGFQQDGSSASIVADTLSVSYVYESDNSYYVINSSGVWSYVSASHSVISNGINWLIPTTADCINRYNDEFLKTNKTSVHPYLYDKKSDGITYGGTGYIVSYEIRVEDAKTVLVDFGRTIVDSTNENFVLKSKSFKQGEVYRIGINAYDLKGKPYFTNWIGDIRIPYFSGVNDIFNSTVFLDNGTDINNVTVDTRNCNIYVSINLTHIDNAICEKISSFDIAYVERSSEDKSIIAQGYSVGGVAYDSVTASYMHNPIPYRSTAEPATSNANYIHTIFSPEFNINGGIVPSGKIRLYVNKILGRPVINNILQDGLNRFDYAYRSDDSGRYASKIVYPISMRSTHGDPSSSTEATLTNHASIQSGFSFEIKDALKLSTVEKSGSKSRLTINNTTNVSFTNRVLSLLTTHTMYAPTCVVFSSNMYLPYLAVSSVSTGYMYLLDVYVDNSSSRYGGNTHSDRTLNQYIKCSDSVVITAPNEYGNYDGVLGLIASGDVYNTVFDTLTSIADPNVDDGGTDVIVGADVDRRQVVALLPVESSINCLLTGSKPSKLIASYPSGKNKDSIYIGLTETQVKGIELYGTRYPNIDDLNSYNTAYSANSKYPTFFAKPELFDENQTEQNVIYASEVKVNGEYVDSWSKFLYANSLEVDGMYGAIHKLTTLNNKLFFFQENAIGVAAVKDRYIIGENTSAGQLALGTGGILERYDYVKYNEGVIRPEHVINTITNLYFIDHNRKVLDVVGQEDVSLSISKGVNSLFRSLYKDKNSFVTIGFDPKYREVLFCITNNGTGKTLVYNENINEFGPRSSATPNLFINLSDQLLSFKQSNNIQGILNYAYRHNAGDIGELYSETLAIDAVDTVDGGGSTVYVPTETIDGGSSSIIASDTLEGGSSAISIASIPTNYEDSSVSILVNTGTNTVFVADNVEFRTEVRSYDENKSIFDDLFSVIKVGDEVVAIAGDVLETVNSIEFKNSYQNKLQTTVVKQDNHFATPGVIPNTSRRHRSWTTAVPMPKDAITNNSTRFVDTFLSMKFTFNNRDNKVFKLHDITTYIRPTHK